MSEKAKKATKEPKESKKSKYGRITYKGREYVTIAEFAGLFHRPRKTIDYLVTKGKLLAVMIPGRPARYLDLKAEGNRYKIWMERQGESTGRPLKGDAQYDPAASTIDDSYFTTAPKAIADRTPEVPSIPGTDIKEPSVGQIINLANINPDDYPDCWVKNATTGEFIINPVTGQHDLNYEKLKLRLVSEKYQLDVKEKRGELISREDVKSFALNIGAILQNALDAVPNRYAAVYCAECTRITGHEFAPDEKERLRSILVKEPSVIMRSIQTAIETFAKEHETANEEN